MSCSVIFSAGSVLRGDDAAGPVLAKRFIDSPLEGWEVVDGGQTPEDDLPTIRRYAPEKIVFVDAASMGLEIGSIRKLQSGDIAKQELVTTHSLPMGFLLGQLLEICDDVTFLGVQVGNMDFFEPLTPGVSAAVDDIEACIRNGADLSKYESMS